MKGESFLPSPLLLLLHIQDAHPKMLNSHFMLFV